MNNDLHITTIFIYDNIHLNLRPVSIHPRLTVHPPLIKWHVHTLQAAGSEYYQLFNLNSLIICMFIHYIWLYTCSYSMSLKRMLLLLTGTSYTKCKSQMDINFQFYLLLAYTCLNEWLIIWFLDFLILAFFGPHSFYFMLISQLHIMSLICIIIIPGHDYQTNVGTFPQTSLHCRCKCT